MTNPIVPSKTEPAKDRPLRVTQRHVGESMEAAVARTLTRPDVQAASTIMALQGGGMLEINSLVQELSDQVEAVNGGNLRRTEGMLISQAHTLDELFNSLARRSHRNMEAGHIQSAETYLRLALKAQTQCRATLETLATVKNPPVFAKQANFANGPQQVNNGVPAHAAPAFTHGEEGKKPEIKKLESRDGQWLDTRATGAAGRADQVMATVGEDQGPKHCRRKGRGVA